jgi:hypothetical protein
VIQWYAAVVLALGGLTLVLRLLGCIAYAALQLWRSCPCCSVSCRFCRCCGRVPAGAFGSKQSASSTLTGSSSQSPVRGRGESFAQPDGYGCGDARARGLSSAAKAAAAASLGVSVSINPLRSPVTCDQQAPAASVDSSATAVGITDRPHRVTLLQTGIKSGL